MSEELKGPWDGGPERRSDMDRRSGMERRMESRRIWNKTALRLFLNRRSGKDRRGGQERRKALTDMAASTKRMAATAERKG